MFFPPVEGLAALFFCQGIRGGGTSLAPGGNDQSTDRAQPKKAERLVPINESRGGRLSCQGEVDLGTCYFHGKKAPRNHVRGLYCKGKKGLLSHRGKKGNEPVEKRKNSC